MKQHRLTLLATLTVAALLAGCLSVPVVTPTATPTATGPATATLTPPASATPTSPVSPTPNSSPTATPTAAATGLAQALAADLQAELEHQQTSRKVPGMAAAVIMPDGSRWSGAAGIASSAPRRRAAADTPFVLGSITKTYTTAVAMQLVAEGRMTLDDPLSNWLPDYPRARRITLRMLLTHSSGVFNYFEHADYTRLVYRDPSHVWSPDEILATFRHAPDFPVGSDYRYSNTGFILLGRVIEVETGASLREQFKERLFDPLGLNSTFFQDERHPVPAGADPAAGFRQTSNGLSQFGDDSGYMPTASVATVAWAAGAMCASAPDLATWISALYGGDVVRSDLLAEMEDWVPSPYPRDDYGLGTRTTVIDGFRAFGHTGSLLGYRAFGWYFPDLRLTIVGVNNRGLVNPDAEARAMFRAAAPAAAQYLGIPYPRSPSP